MSEGFLSRWSRLKDQARQPEPVQPPEPEPAPEAAPAQAAEAPPPPDLPPVDSLTPDSDFSPFLQAGVPDAIKRAAMAKLWSSDPLFSQPEIYDLHMEDYAFPTKAEVIKTAWNFGKEMVEELRENQADPEESAKQAPETANKSQEDSAG